MLSDTAPLDKFVYFAAINRVASFPEVIAAIRSAVADKGSTPASVARAVERDVAFSSRLLRMVNAPEIGLIRPCSSVAHAVSLIGMGRIGMIAEGTASRAAIEQCAAIAPEIAKRVTTHAAIARVLASAVGAPAEQAFTAALLCDVGAVAIHATHQNHWSQTMNTNVDLLVAERESFGFDHAELGGEILKRWNLPSPIPEVVTHHHDLDAAHACGQDVARLVALLQAAEILANRVVQEESITEDALSDLAGHPAVPLLGLDAEKVAALWTELRASFAREMAPAVQKEEDEEVYSQRASAPSTKTSPYRAVWIAAAILVPSALTAAFAILH